MTKHSNKIGYSCGLLRIAVAMAVFAGDILVGQGLPGALRVRVADSDWDAPVSQASVSIPDREIRLLTGKDGQVLIENVVPGSYTVVVSADGFERRVMQSVVVLPGQVQETDCRLSAVYTDLDEFVVKDLETGNGGNEITLLDLRSKSSTLLDSVGSELMSKAGAGTAAAALKMVSGATVQDGKYAVIRGLGDRYTAALMNGVRLPNADRDKRAVSLDQFPSVMIESVQISKAFTPDQQGDATGGINITTKGVPDKRVLQVGTSMEYDTNATGNDKFKTYGGGGNDLYGMRGLTGLDFWKKNTGTFPRGGEESGEAPGGGAVVADKAWSSGVRSEAPPANYGYKFAAGDYVQLNDDWRFGGIILGSLSQKYKYRTGSQQYLYGVEDPRDFRTEPSEAETIESSLNEQLWSFGFTTGLQNEYNRIKFTTLYTHQSKDLVELRTKDETKTSTTTLGTVTENAGAIPGSRPKKYYQYTKSKTEQTTGTRNYASLLQYTENANASAQLDGEHKFSFLNDSVFDWSGSYNVAESIEPDRRRISGTYANSRTVEYRNTVPKVGAGEEPSPVWDNGTVTGESETMGVGGERRWQDTREDDFQGQLNYKQPFQVVDGWDGWLKTGGFADSVKRTYRNRIYNVNAGNQPVSGGMDFTVLDAVDSVPLGNIFSESTEYNGSQDIQACYLMGRLPMPEWLDIIGGARIENTKLETEVFPSYGNNSFFLYEKITPEMVTANPNVYSTKNIGLIGRNSAVPGQGDAAIDQTDVLPAVGLNIKPWEQLSFRLSYGQTVARPIFKEITPVKYMDYDSSRVFLGNPDLAMSLLNNYDFRVEWRPDKTKADMIGAGVFYKTISDPIQYSVRTTLSPDVDYIYPENYGDAQIKGFEVEARKDLDFISRYLRDFSVGGNLTMQESEVEYRSDIRTLLLEKGIGATTRTMDGQSDILANLNLIFDNEASGFSAGIFYNWRGETCVAGDSASTENYFPAIVENPVGTLDVTFGYRFRVGENRFSPTWKLAFECKNLLDPEIETIYRTPYADIPRTSYTVGRIYGVSLGCEW